MKMKHAGGAFKEETRRNMTAASMGGLPSLKSPIPYLFGGLAFLFILISLSLFILACSHIKHSSSSYNEDDEEERKRRVEEDGNEVVDSEPKIVVVMPGDSNPSFLAKPI